MMATSSISGSPSDRREGEGDDLVAVSVDGERDDSQLDVLPNSSLAGSFSVSRASTRTTSSS